MQSKWQSLVESATQTVVAFLLSLFIQPVVLGLFNLTINHAESAAIAAIFTLISLVRGYIVRRMFNWWHHVK